MLSWSELRHLIEYGTGLPDRPVGPVQATVRVTDDPGVINMTARPDLPLEVLRLAAGDYLVVAEGSRRAVSTTHGEPLLAADGERLLVRSTEGDVVDVAGGDVRLHCGQAGVTDVEYPGASTTSRSAGNRGSRFARDVRSTRSAHARSSPPNSTGSPSRSRCPHPPAAAS